MSNAVATQQPTALATNEQRQQLREFDRQLKQFRNDLANPELGVMEKLSIQADAILFIQDSITPELMSKAMKLMNTPLGFKTDKTSSPFYSEDVVKKALVVALLNGAQITGNQFNIIAGQCYLTKEFYRPAILRWPGLRNFEHYIGIPSMFGDRAHVFEGKAQWEIDGELFEMVFRKNENGIDNRIVVKSTPASQNYPGSSPDELRGKAEAKLYNRVWQRLTGLNMDVGDDDYIDGTVAPRTENIQQEAEPVVEADPESEPEVKITNSEAAKIIAENFKADVEKLTQLKEVIDTTKSTLAFLATHDWDQGLKDGTKDTIEEISNDRIAAIKSTRGENSNKQ